VIYLQFNLDLFIKSVIYKLEFKHTSRKIFKQNLQVKEFIMKLNRIFSALLMSVFLTLPVVAADDAEKVFSGTVKIDSTQMAFIISGQSGGGTLEFEGNSYDFDIGGLGIGGIGVQTINAVGAVYNLNSLNDFSGTYIQGRAGLTVGSGKGAMSLTNTKTGAILELKASTEGAALSLGVDGMIVTLKK
jgi:hypothetical protein